MKKNIFITLICGLLLLSITINVSTSAKLDKSYEKINESIASDYLKINESFINLSHILKENEELSSEEFITLYENHLSSESHNTVYSYAMDINTFKWLHDDYNYANLDGLASYLIHLQLRLSDAPDRNMKEIKTALLDLCRKWQELHLSRAIINDTYDFQTDPRNLSKALASFNDYCYSCMD